MANLLRFLIQFEFLFYAVLAVVIIIYLRKLFIAGKQWKLAYFGLEKETAQAIFTQHLTVLIVSALMVLGLFTLTTFVAPSVPGVQILPTATVDLTAQPTSGPDTTPTFSSTTTGFIATLEAVYGQGCIPDQINWTEPRTGDTLTGTVVLKGTVNVTSLGYYKYEYSPVGNENWTTIAAGNQAVENAALGGSWDTSNLIPGEYLLRLIVTDSKNEEYPPCTVQVNITAPK